MAKVEEGLVRCADPVVTANVYCKDRIDEILFTALKPFQDEYLASRDGWGFWVMRYRRCGEHLKIRLHGTEASAEVKQALSDYLQRAAARIQWPELVKQTKVTGAADPVIDQQDQADSDYAPGTVIFTDYNRSHVTFGGSPYLEDPLYAALFSRVLVAGCRYILANAVPAENGALGHGTRATVLAELLEAARVELCLEKPAAYFEYHRDWLVRFVLFKTAHTPDEQKRVIEAFDKRIQAANSFWADLWARSHESVAEAPANFTEWRESLRSLMEYTWKLCDQQQYQIDPFASHPSHSVLFKALHGVSNQLGLALLDEALVHHSLCRSWAHAGPALVAHAG